MCGKHYVHMYCNYSQVFHVSESVQNDIQFAKRSSQMAKLLSGHHYVKALAELVNTFKQPDTLCPYKSKPHEIHI